MKRQNKFLLTAALIASLMGGVSVQADKQDPNAVAPNTQKPDPRIKKDSESEATWAGRLAVTAYDLADEVRTDVGDLKKKINGITVDSQKIGDIEKILNGNGADDKGLTGKVADINKVLSGEHGNGGLEENLKKLMETVNGDGNANSGLVGKVKANEEAITQHNTDISNLKKEIGEDDNNGLKKEIKDIKEAIGDATKGLTKGVADNKTAIDKNTEAIGDATKGLTKGVADNKTAIDKNTEAIGDATKGLTKGVADNKTAIDKNTEAIGDATKGLTKGVADNKTAIDKNTEAIGDATKGLTKGVADNKTAIDKNTEAIGDATKGLTKGVADNKTAIDKNTEAIGDATKGLTKGVADNKTAIDKNTEAIGKNADDIATNKADIKDLKEHKADLSKLNSDVDGLKKEDARIEKEYKAADTQIIKEYKAADTQIIKEYKAADVRLGMRMDQLATDTNKGMAKMAALASLHPLEYDGVNRFNVAVATGSYRGENAVAMGAFFRPSKDVLVSLSASLTGGDSAYGFGISARLGRSGGASYSGDSSAVSELYHLVGELQDKLEAQQRKIDELEARA